MSIVKKYSFPFLLAWLVGLAPSFSQNTGDIVFDHTIKKGNSSPISTLIRKKPQIKGFGGLDLRVARVNGQTSLLSGIHGGITINQKFIVGMAAAGLSSEQEVVNPINKKQLILYGGHAGLVLGYIYQPTNTVHLSFPLLIGGGVYELVDEQFVAADRPNNVYEEEVVVASSDFVLVMQSVKLNVNITSWCRFGMGVAYSFMGDINLLHLDSKDLGNLSSEVSLSFGAF